LSLGSQKLNFKIRFTQNVDVKFGYVLLHNLYGIAEINGSKFQAQSEMLLFLLIWRFIARGVRGSELHLQLTQLGFIRDDRQHAKCLIKWLLML
jgi:hypothetical protein